MVQVSSRYTGVVIPYQPLPTPKEFIRLEWEKAEEEEMIRILRSSLCSSVSTVVSFGTDSSVSFVGGTSSFLLDTSSVKEVKSACSSSALLPALCFEPDSERFIDDLYSELDQMGQLYRDALNTQKSCVELWGQLGTILEEMSRCQRFSLVNGGMVSHVVWQNCLDEVGDQQDRIWLLFLEATQSVVDIRIQLDKLIKIGERFLVNYKQ